MKTIVEQFKTHIIEVVKAATQVIEAVIVQRRAVSHHSFHLDPQRKKVHRLIQRKAVEAGFQKLRAA